MEEWQIRVKQELKELNEKTEKLTFLIGSPKWLELDREDMKLLAEQHCHMCNYARVLAERIKRFE